VTYSTWDSRLATMFCCLTTETTLDLMDREA
jgi:hypothetical protein